MTRATDVRRQPASTSLLRRFVLASMALPMLALLIGGLLGGLPFATAAQSNSPPDAQDDVADTAEDIPLTIDVTLNDTDPDGNLDKSTVQIVSAPSSGSAVSNGDGTVTYTPNLNANGGDAFSYQICDTAGACDTATVTISVLAINDPPAANDDGATTNTGTAVVLAVLANDSDAEGGLNPASVTVTSAAANGTTSVNATTGDITYTPNAGFNGADTFSYQVCDTTALCDSANVSVTVAPPTNTPPVANDDAITTTEDTAVQIAVLANDTDAEGGLNPASVTVTSAPTNGTTSVNTTTGVVTYTPNANFNGADSFVYSVCDVGSACDTATVTVTVSGANDPPVVVNDSASTAEDTAVTINVLTNDSDPEGALVTSSVTVIIRPTRGSATPNSSGAVTYTPQPNFNGSDSFVYQVCDAQSACGTATVNMTVTPVNDAPVANNDAATVQANSQVSINILANDSDVDRDISPSSVTVVTAPTHGTATVITSSGGITYRPNTGYSGTDSLTYRVCDTGGLCDTATVTITVTPPGTATRTPTPTATSSSGSLATARPTSTPRPTLTPVSTGTPRPTATPGGTPAPDATAVASQDSASEEEPAAPELNGLFDLRTLTSGAAVRPGSRATFVVTARNVGAITLTEVELELEVVGPSRPELVSFPTGKLDVNSDGIVLSLDEMRPGEQLNTQVQVVVDPDATGSITACATARSLEAVGLMDCQVIAVDPLAPETSSTGAPGSGQAPRPLFTGQGGRGQVPEVMDAAEARYVGDRCLRIAGVTVTCTPFVRWWVLILGVMLGALGVWWLLAGQTRRKTQRSGGLSG